MKTLLITALFAAGGGFAAPAFAQPAGDQGPAVVASQPVPDTSAATPGIPPSQAVNPAPNATGPYVGAGRANFYDVGQRISAVEGRLNTLSGAQRRNAAAKLKAIRSEEATQRARHGGVLRDWTRESLSVKLDHLVKQYPSLDVNEPPMSSQ